MGFFAGIAALCTPIALVVFWIFATRGRRNHPKWEILRRFRYAHRGLHDPAQGVPENSMAAFRRARAFQCGIELDVHLTKDGHLAVIHDKSLLRTAGADVIVEQLTVPQLKNYRLEGTQEKIPLLEEVLEMEDAWAGAGERACAAHFFLGLQMGLDLGKLNYLREE